MPNRKSFKSTKTKSRPRLSQRGGAKSNSSYKKGRLLRGKRAVRKLKKSKSEFKKIGGVMKGKGGKQVKQVNQLKPRTTSAGSTLVRRANQMRQSFKQGVKSLLNKKATLLNSEKAKQFSTKLMQSPIAKLSMQKGNLTPIQAGRLLEFFNYDTVPDKSELLAMGYTGSDAYREFFDVLNKKRTGLYQKITEPLSISNSARFSILQNPTRQKPTTGPIRIQGQRNSSSKPRKGNRGINYTPNIAKTIKAIRSEGEVKKEVKRLIKLRDTNADDFEALVNVYRSEEAEQAAIPRLNIIREALNRLPDLDTSTSNRENYDDRWPDF